MTPSHANKKGTRYRYYVSRPLIAGPKDTGRGRRLPAATSKSSSGDRLCSFLTDAAAVLNAVDAQVHGAADQKHLIDRAARLAGTWTTVRAGRASQDPALALVMRIDVHADRVDICLDPVRLPASLDPRVRRSGGETKHGQLPNCSDSCAGAPEARRDGNEDGHRRRTRRQAGCEFDQGHRQGARLEAGGPGQGRHDPADHRPVRGMIGSYLTRLLRLTFLAPDIVTAILEGGHPPGLTAHKLMRDTRLPLDWDEQRRLLGFV